jgi:PAS domain S-box-containing protein
MSAAPAGGRGPADAGADRSVPPAAVQRALLEGLHGSLDHALWAISPDPDWTVLHVSPALARLWDRSVEALYDPLAWREGIHPEDLPRVERVVGEWLAREGAGGYRDEYRIVHGDGSVRWVRATGFPARRTPGQPLILTGLTEDITARREAEAVVERQRQRLEALVRTAPSVLCSLRQDPDGRLSFTTGTERMARLCGLPDDTPLALDAAPVFALILPEDRDRVLDAVARSATWLAPWSCEFRIRRPDGALRWLSGLSMPLPDEDGGITWHGAITDVTERRETDEALAHSQMLNAAVLRHLGDGLLTCALDGSDLHWNEAAIAVHGLENDLPLHDVAAVLRQFRLFTLEGRPLKPAEFPMARVIAGETLQGLELRVTRPSSGWERVLRYTGAQVRDAEGRPQLALLQIADVTRRARSEEAVRRLNAELEARVAERTGELSQAVAELEAFTYSVSHDLRAPLRAIDGFSQALIEDLDPAQLPEDARRHLAIIRDTTRRMGTLIDDLLEFSRLSRQPLVRRRVDTGALVRHVWESLAPQREGRTLDLRIASPLPDCEGDLALLRQVWMNLLGNAVKYTRGRAEATITLSADTDAQGRQRFHVRDNGAGFDMRYAHKLFGVFERLHRAEDFEGSGVGLAIVQRIVHRHGGEVSAEGAIGQGACFRFSLGPIPTVTTA